jgi:outer membrane receptor protein involved in Fe transport
MALNIGKSHLYGAEIEARVRPIDGLTLFASIGLLKTKFDEATTFDGTSVVNYAGNEFPEAPSVTAAIGGTWKHRSGFFVSADVSYTHGYFSPRDLSNSPLRHVSSFTLVNTQIGYETKYGTVAIFSRNLFDEQYLTSIATPDVEATIGDGRVVGVRGTARF